MSAERNESPAIEFSTLRHAVEIVRQRMAKRTRSGDIRRIEITLTLTTATASELYDDDIVPPDMRKVLLERTTKLELDDGLNMSNLPENFLDGLPNLRSVKLYEASHESTWRCFGEQLRPCDCHTGGEHYYPRDIQSVTYEFADIGNDDEEQGMTTDRSQACLLSASPRAERVCVKLEVWGCNTACELDEWLVQQPLTALSIGFKKLTCISTNDCKWGYFGDHIFRHDRSDRCPQTAEMSLVELVNVDFTHAKQQFEDFMRQVSQVPHLETLRFKDCCVPPKYWWEVLHEFYGMRVANFDLSGTFLGAQGAGALWKALPYMRGLKYLDVSHCMNTGCEKDLAERIATMTRTKKVVKKDAPKKVVKKNAPKKTAKKAQPKKKTSTKKTSTKKITVLVEVSSCGNVVLKGSHSEYHSA